MTRILGLMHDLFFRSKVDAVSHAMGIDVVYAVRWKKPTRDAPKRRRR